MIELRTCIFARRRLPESLICNLLLLWLGASEASEAHTSHEWTVRGARDCHCLPIPEMYAAPKMLLVMFARCQPGQRRRHPCLSDNPESNIYVRHPGRKVYTNTECGVGTYAGYACINSQGLHTASLWRWKRQIHHSNIGWAERFFAPNVDQRWLYNA